MMTSYPIKLENDASTILATSPDFPELTTFGGDRSEALSRAIAALEEAVAARMHTGQDIPDPSSGKPRVTLSTVTEVKVALYKGMREQGIGKAELARRLNWHLPQVERVLDIQHHSRLDQLDAALGAIGHRLQVDVKNTSSAPA